MEDYRAASQEKQDLIHSSPEAYHYWAYSAILEAKRVFLLQPEGATIPHPMAKTARQREQEYNILYIAITRAIEEFVYVS